MVPTITINSIRHQSFVNTLLNDQTALFQAIQFSITHLFAQFKCQTVLFDPYIGPYQVLPLRSTFPKTPALLEPPHQIV